MDLSALLLGIVLPAAVAVVTRWIAGQLGFRGLALPLGLAMLCGAAATQGWPSFPPRESSGWLPYAVLLATLIGALEDHQRFLRVLPITRWALVAALIWFLLKPLHTLQWSGYNRWLILVGLWLGVMLSWRLLAMLARRSALLPPLVLLAFATAGVELFSGFMKFAQLAAVLAASLVGCWLTPPRRRPPALTPGSVTVVAITLASLWLGGYFYGSMPLLSAVLIAGSPFSLWLLQFRPAQRLPSWVRHLGGLVLVGIPAGLAIAIAHHDYATDPYGY